ncbi:hypothetical protein SAMN04487912_106166 [Arthrobacter sp. cf158]|nr:hypothetical protein SAMN04487912_106166 [Arthrobacter sp. cf158]
MGPSVAKGVLRKIRASHGVPPCSGPAQPHEHCAGRGCLLRLDRARQGQTNCLGYKIARKPSPTFNGSDPDRTEAGANDNNRRRPAPVSGTQRRIQDSLKDGLLTRRRGKAFCGQCTVALGMLASTHHCGYPGWRAADANPSIERRRSCTGESDRCSAIASCLTWTNFDAASKWPRWKKFHSRQA